MATKKQRRRREKLMRHEYEYVVDTEDGQEVVESPRVAKPKASTASGKNVPPGAIVDARGRVVQPPSWRRVLKRGAIFGPILVVLMFVLGGNLTTGARIVNAVFMLVIFLPMSYLTDMLIYRSVAKRQRRPSSR
jgi:hypothetical protein